MASLLTSLFFASLLFFMLLAISIGAPLVFSKPKVGERMIQLLSLKKGQTLYDLGSGDGRLLIKAAKLDLRAVGVEINPYAVIVSLIVAYVTGQVQRIRVYWGNYWWKNISQADGVTVYAMPQITRKLSQKFKRELKIGTRVVSNSFQIPDLKLLKEETVAGTRIYLYQV